LGEALREQFVVDLNDQQHEWVNELLQKFHPHPCTKPACAHGQITKGS
jgi:hypothetical protein